MSRRAVVEIGDGDGRIALYLNERSAIDLAHVFGPSDACYDEIMQAVEEAYPPPSEDYQPRLRIVVRERSA